MDYQKAYSILFGAITQSTDLQTQSLEILKQAQQKTEDMYIEKEDTPVIQLVKKEDEE